MFPSASRITIILLLVIDGFQCPGESTVCPKDCQCAVCPITDLKNMTEIHCNTSNLAKLQLPRNSCSLVLSRSRISILDKKSLKSFDGILYLNLSFNLITKVSKRTFANVKSLKRLYLDNNLISTIQKSAFLGLLRLEYLDLSHNQIEALPESETFKGLYTLNKLDLSYNRLELLTSEMFRGTPSLKTLYLQHNEVTNLQRGTFLGLGKLEELHLNDNRLDNLTDEIFRGIPSLKTLYLQHNGVMTLQRGTFLGLGKLEELYLNENRLENLTNEMFRGMPSLKTLYLQHSEVTTLQTGTFLGLGKLEKLYLNDNRLENLTDESFRGIPSLKTLYLQHNGVTTLQRGTFLGLGKLEELYLNENRLENLTKDIFRGMPSLKTLYLQRNEVTTLQKGTFLGLGKLEKLYLNDNRLENLADEIFRGIPSLKTLYLQHNEITTIQRKAFWGLRNLEKLDLSYNQLVDLSLDVFSVLQNLRHLNLEGNNLTSQSNDTSAAAMLLNISNTVQAGITKNTTSEIRGCSRIDRKKLEFEVPVSRKRVRCTTNNCSAKIVLVTKTKTVTTRFNICWDVINKLRVLLFALGAVAFLSNQLVVATVIRVRTLRNNAAFILVSHMAFCDLLVGVYSLGMAIGHGQERDEFTTWKEYYCPYYRSIFVFATVVGGLSSLLVTCERYLAIVFCMNPNLRLTRKAILIALSFSWVLGATSAGLVQILDTRNNQQNGDMCLIIRNRYKTSSLYVSELLLLLMVFVYLIVFFLYLHIFLSVRKSARSLGLTRESTLAKRIGVIVLSSFVFFAVPNFVLAWFIFNGGDVFEYAVLNRTLIWWLPPVCLVVNACLNPCVFAFRNEKFVKALKEVVACLLPKQTLKRKRAKRYQNDAYTVSSTVDIVASSQSIASPIQLRVFSSSVA